MLKLNYFIKIKNFNNLLILKIKYSDFKTNSNILILLIKYQIIKINYLKIIRNIN